VKDRKTSDEPVADSNIPFPSIFITFLTSIWIVEIIVSNLDHESAIEFKIRLCFLFITAGNRLIINKNRIRRETFPGYLFFLICIVGVESKLGPLGTSATYWPIVPAPGDCEYEEFGGMNGRGDRSTWRKPAPAPLCPPQIPLDQTRN
jgi:hypothetical protein